MSETQTMRLSQVARKLNVGLSTIVETLNGKGHDISSSPNTKITGEQYSILQREFKGSAQDKEEASELTIGTKHKEDMVLKAKAEEVTPVADSEDSDVVPTHKLQGIKVVGKIDLNPKKKTEPAKAEVAPIKEAPKAPEPKAEVAPAKVEPVKPAVEVKKEEPKAPPVVEAPKPVEKVPAKEEPKAPIAETPKPVEKKPEATQAPAAKKEEKPTTPIAETPKKEEVITPEIESIKAKADNLKGLTVLGKIELPKPVASSDKRNRDDKKKRKRVRVDKPGDNRKPGTPGQGGPQGQGNNNQGGGYKGKPGNNTGGGYKGKGGNQGGGRNNPREPKPEITDAEIQNKIKETIARLQGGKDKGNNRSKYRKGKRDAHAEERDVQAMLAHEEAKILRVTEFISANDLASLMNVSVNEVISICMGLGMFVSINQRLDAESITLIADEFGYKIEFTTTEEQDEAEGEEDEDPALLTERAPVVTIMGHVDHGKTSLLDYIRHADVAAGEAGGITQHIGAYSVKVEGGKKITFLDTPGHEAFTAMRARGAKLTDIVIIVVAADDRVMPQTKEAINHAQVAGVPIIIAINKIDKPTANSDKIREELSAQNILVEDWGGKYQCQEVSAKSGIGIPELLEKVLLEAEVLELKANANREANGTVVEASLDKGRGYLANVLVQRGTLNIGDIVVAGQCHGRVKAMTDHRGRKLKSVGPSTPLQLLGLDGAPQAGDKLLVVQSEREAREITTKRAQIIREQSVRTKKHLTLDEIGRRLAIGNFKELNLIIKGDVDGSVEALTDSLLKLSTAEVQVNIIHKGVGQITESDVLLATASDAILIGFQVRPSASAKRIAEQEEIEIRTYSIIYKAIEEMKDALEGMLDPETEEVIVGNIQIRDVFKITKVGTVAGCYVLDGLVKRSNTIRIIREGVVTYEGQIGALKRFKDDVSEVKFGYECGLSIKNFNDLQIDDIIEAYEIRETKRKLK